LERFTDSARVDETVDFPEHWKFVRRERGERRDDERDQRENEQNFMV
jgi:hypothetical protein